MYWYNKWSQNEPPLGTVIDYFISIFPIVVLTDTGRKETKK